MDRTATVSAESSALLGTKFILAHLTQRDWALPRRALLPAVVWPMWKIAKERPFLDGLGLRLGAGSVIYGILESRQRDSKAYEDV